MKYHYENFGCLRVPLRCQYENGRYICEFGNNVFTTENIEINLKPRNYTVIKSHGSIIEYDPDGDQLCCALMRNPSGEGILLKCASRGYKPYREPNIQYVVEVNEAYPVVKP